MGEKLNVSSKTGSTTVLGRKLTIIPGTAVSTARDDGNTPTTTLRAGIPLGRIDASGKFMENDATASDGSETFVGLLAEDTDLLDETGTAADTAIGVIVAGEVNQSIALARGDANFSLANAKLAQPGIIWQTPPALYFPGA